MEHLTINPPKIRGFSLVEIMVSLTIGLIILSAVSMLFVGSKKSYTTQDSLARLQENARFAMQFLVKDIRQAGYYGCLSDVGEDGENVNSTLNPVTTFTFSTEMPLDGTEGGASSDTITIRKGDTSSAVNIAGEMPTTSAELKVTTTDGFGPNDIIMVSDCISADIMQITAVQEESSHLQHNAPGGTPPEPGDTDYPGNAKGDLSKKYKPGGAQVMKYTTAQYSIGTGASGAPALFRGINGNTPVELVEGIEQMQIQYGIDTDTVPGLDRYVTADNIPLNADGEPDWTRVRSVRIGMLARTLSDKETDIDNNTYDIDGDGNLDVATAPGDHFKRRIFQTVVQLRNSQ